MADHSASRGRRVGSDHVALLVVLAAASAYTVFVAAESLASHRSFVTGFDTALYDQLLWLLANGHESFSTVVSRPMLGDHFQPGLALFVPVAWLGGGVEALLVLQTLALASTAPALYSLGRTVGAAPAAAAVPALLWLASPFVVRLNLGDFRPTAVASVLIVVSVLAAIRGRVWLLAVTALVAISLKEDVALVYLMLGIVLVLQGRRRLGGTLAAASTAWLVVALLVMRSTSDAAAAFGRRFAGDRGETIAEALVWMALHPLGAAEHVLRESAFYLALLLVTVGGLAFLAPLWTILALPSAAHNALSAYEPQHLLSFHYHQFTMTALFIAAALGTPRLRGVRRAVQIGAGLGVAAAVVLAAAAASWAHSHWTQGIALARAPTVGLLALIPESAPVAASTHLLPHLSRRVEVYALPEPFIPLDTGSPLDPSDFAARAARVDHVVYREGDLPFEYEGNPATVLAMLRREGFVAVAEAGPVTLFRRQAAQP